MCVAEIESHRQLSRRRTDAAAETEFTPNQVALYGKGRSKNPVPGKDQRG